MEKNDPRQPDLTPDGERSDPRPPDDTGVPLEPPGDDDAGPERPGDLGIDMDEGVPIAKDAIGDSVPEPPRPQGPRVERSGEVEPIPLESSGGGSHGSSPDDEYVHSLDVCSNCGAPMRGETMVCLRCGWNMRTGRVERVKTGVVEVDDHGREHDEKEDEDAEDQGRLTPLSEPGRGGAIAPLIMAGVAALLLLVGYMFGAAGLFPQNNQPDTTMARLIEFASQMVVLVLGMCCGVIALSFLGWLLKARLGDLALAAARMLGIVAMVLLVDFINLPSTFLESVLELTLKTATFALLSSFFFKLSLRDAVTLTLSFIMAAFCLVALTFMVRLVI